MGSAVVGAFLLLFVGAVCLWIRLRPTGQTRDEASALDNLPSENEIASVAEPVQGGTADSGIYESLDSVDRHAKAYGQRPVGKTGDHYRTAGL